MKKYTKKFLTQKLKNNASLDNIYSNAKEAEKILSIPSKLWIELSNKFPKSKLRSGLEKSGNYPTAFMAGFVIGWVENNKKIK